MIEAESTQLVTLEEARGQISGTLTRLLQGAPNPVHEMAAHLAAAQGKGVRALLLLHTAAGPDGMVVKDAVALGAAVELLHMATLVHDDVIDDADLRRGAPTLHRRFGKKQAVICGDYLLCLAASLVAPLQGNYREYEEFFTMFTTALSRVCMGELLQLKNNRNIGLDVSGYLRIVSGKTAALFYVAALAGALVARSGRKEAMRLARFGRYLGMAFQIVDDCKDFEFSESRAKKTVGKDIAEGVVTLPLIYAMQTSPGLKESAENAFGDSDLAKQIAKAVCLAGGTKKSMDLAARYEGKAAPLLSGFPESKARSLVALFSKIIRAANVF